MVMLMPEGKSKRIRDNIMSQKGIESPGSRQSQKSKNKKGEKQRPNTKASKYEIKEKSIGM
jgi:hypothetical protein